MGECDHDWEVRDATGAGGCARVGDGHAIAGPIVGTFLGDMGAEVIKCEECAFGDTMRRAYPPPIDGISGYFLLSSRNKKSFTLNLRTPKGQEIFKELVSLSVAGRRYLN